MKTIHKFKNFLSLEVYKEIYNISRNISWKNPKALDMGYSSHFNYTIIDSDEGVSNMESCYKYIFQKLKKMYNVEYLPHNLYYNLSKFGDECAIHSDRKTKFNNKTFILYLTNTWDPNWHGETVFYEDDKNEIITGNLPYPNNAVIFDSNINHAVAPISKFCKEDRVVLVAQMEYKGYI